MVNTVVERLNPNAISDQPELTPFRVPQCNGKHAAKLVNTVDTPFFESMQYYFGIRMVRFPPVSAPGLQFLTDFGVIINLAIKDHPNSAVFVTHRLHRSFGYVDDRQPPKPQAQPPVRP